MINEMLYDVNGVHHNIKLVRQIGSAVSFLDVSIENQNGALVTSVHHKQAAAPYVIPFKSDHSRHTFRNIIQTALLRAVPYSSTLSIFDDERRPLKLLLLYNGYLSFARFHAYIIFFHTKLPTKIHQSAIRQIFLNSNDPIRLYSNDRQRRRFFYYALPSLAQTHHSRTCIE